MTPKEALDWIENVFEEHHVQLPDVELTLVRQSLNELERLKKFKETFDNYELAKKQDFIAYENWLECERELEELKKDLDRFLELDNMLYLQGWHTKEETEEHQELRYKLTKVGKEDE